MAGWRLEHTYTELPQLFYSDALPTAVREPRLVAFNRPLATRLELEPDALEREEGAAIFAGNVLPDGFMDAYDPATVFSSIDAGGRYAYGNQPAIAQWNLARLAEAMLPLLDPHAEQAVERAPAALARFPAVFEKQRLDGMRAKLGLCTRERDDVGLIDDLLAWMQRRSADFTNTFRWITTEGLLAQSTNTDPELEAWYRRLEARRERQPQSSGEAEVLMRRHNPAFIPRNHKVEEALSAADSSDDWTMMARLLEVLARPYDYDRDLPAFSAPGVADGSYRTFCGT